MLHDMPARIVIVEDEGDIAFPLVRTLEREGYDVVWVDNGQKALDDLAATPADVVILDLGLPDMDGTEVIAGEGRIGAIESSLLPISEGAAYFALRSGVPLVPAGIRGTFEAFPRGIDFPVLPEPASPPSLPTAPVRAFSSKRE